MWVGGGVRVGVLQKHELRRRGATCAPPQGEVQAERTDGGESPPQSLALLRNEH